MNRGFKQYFKESYKKSRKTLKNINNYLRYLLFIFMDFAATFCIFVKPITKVATVKMAKNVNDGKNVCISSSVVTTDNPKAYWNYVLVACLKMLIWFGIGAIIIIIGALLFLFGISITSLLGGSDSLVLPIVLAVPAIVILIAFLFARPYLSVSTAYLVDTYSKTNASKQLYSSFESMKKSGKKTLFANDLVHAGLILLFLLPSLIIMIIAITSGSGLIALAILLVILSALYFVPRLLLSRQLIIVSLYDDIVLDDRTLTQKFIGIDADKFSNTTQPIGKRLLNVFESEDEINLEAKLFQEIPAAKVIEKVEHSVKPVVEETNHEEEIVIPLEEELLDLEAELDDLLIPGDNDEVKETQVLPTDNEESLEVEELNDESLDSLNENETIVEENLDNDLEESEEETFDIFEEKESENEDIDLEKSEEETVSENLDEISDDLDDILKDSEGE